MEGEREFFRKKVFGGFNREDVVKYIAKIANERNEALAAKVKAEKKAQVLAEEVLKLREKINGPVTGQPGEEPESTEKQISYDEESVINDMAAIKELSVINEQENAEEQTVVEEQEPAVVEEPAKIKITRRR